MDDSVASAAVRYARFGPPDVLEVVSVPVPSPGPGEVVVRVRAAGVNPVDVGAAYGPLPFGPPPRFPAPCGWDVAGEVVAVGAGVDSFAERDAVFGLAGFPAPAGTFAEYAAVSAADLSHRPDGMDWPQAGGLPLVGLTVLQAFAAIGGPRSGQRVLVEAAAGGVGHVAVQVAKSAGCYVLGSASAPKHDFLRSLGVDEPIDYAAHPDVYRDREPVDVVLTSSEAPAAAEAVASVAPGGAVVSIKNGITGEVAAAAADRGVRHANMLVHPDAAGLAELAGMVVAGRLRVHVSDTFALAEVVAAYRAVATGHTTGKVVLLPSGA
jgi:NADPH:quinone reductase-like Zn-dependent oxidoreductase